MTRFRKYIVALAIMCVAAASTDSLSSADYVYDAYGCGYQQCRKAPCIAPAIALGTIALVAIIAVVVQNQEGGNNHGHCH